MAQTIYVDEFLDWLVALINDDLGSTLSLTICQKGDLSYYPAEADLSDDCPAVLIKCTDIAFEPDSNATNYHVTYSIRIIYVNTVTVTANVIDDTNSKARTLAEKIIDNSDAESFDEAAKVEQFIITSIEFEPPENAAFQGMDKEIKAFAITCEATLYARR